MQKPATTKRIEKEIPEGSFTLTIEDGRSLVLTKPNRTQIGQALGLLMPVGGGAPDVLKAGEWLLNACFHSGDRSILTDEEALLPACMSALEMIKIKEASLKKN